jgi:hypothetical protein
MKNESSFMIEQSMVTEVIKNNQVLTSAIDLAEKRCGLLERKVEKK